jgi:glutaredoxin
MAGGSTLILVTRRGCGLCEEAAEDLSRLGVAYELADVDQDERLKLLYDEAVPVLLRDGVEVARAPISFEKLHSLRARDWARA